MVLEAGKVGYESSWGILLSKVVQCHFRRIGLCDLWLIEQRAGFPQIDNPLTQVMVLLVFS